MNCSGIYKCLNILKSVPSFLALRALESPLKHQQVLKKCSLYSENLKISLKNNTPKSTFKNPRWTTLVLWKSKGSTVNSTVDSTHTHTHCSQGYSAVWLLFSARLLCARLPLLCARLPPLCAHTCGGISLLCPILLLTFLPTNRLQLLPTNRLHNPKAHK